MLKLPPVILNAAQQLIGPRCTKTLLIDYNLSNSLCLRLALSKLLSLAIILGSILVKLPQIGKLLYTRRTDGLSFLGYLMETLAVSVNFAYNLRMGNPFTSYGETLFISGQNLMIVVLLAVYRQKFMLLLVVLGAYSVFMSGLLLPNLYPLDGNWLAYLQAATLPLAACSRLPQIHQTWRSGHTGQLSALTVFLVSLGSLARLYTTWQEVGKDQLLLAGFSLGAILNSVIALQMLWYWNSAKSKSAAAKKQKRN